MFVGVWLGDDNQYHSGWTTATDLTKPHEMMPLKSSKDGGRLLPRYGFGLLTPGPATLVDSKVPNDADAEPEPA